MTLIQTQAKAPGAGGRAQFAGPVLAAVAVIVVIAFAGAFGTSLTARQGGTVLTTRGDPLVQSGAVQFRAAEHAASLSLVDPLVAPAAVEFRAGEHAATTAEADFLIQLRAIQYRLRLHAASLAQPDPLLRPDAIQFRASEHAAGVIQGARKYDWYPTREHAAAVIQGARKYDWYPTREHAAGVSEGAGVRAGEHPAGATARDWLSKPGATTFPASEHGTP
jgi:hypothetical protein